MMEGALTNKQYGKWNAVLGLSKQERFVLYQNHSKMFPETLQDWICALKTAVKENRFAPVRMDIDLTNFCNNNCVMCFSKYLQQSKQCRIPFNKALSIFEDFKALGGKSVRLTGGGDCLTYPKITEILHFLADIDLKITIETNGDLLSGESISDAVARYVSHLRISVDSGDTYSRLMVHRPVSKSHSYDSLIENIKKVIRKRDVCNREDELYVGATFVVLPENYETLTKFIRDMKEIRINWIAIRKNIYRDVYNANPEILSQSEKVLNEIGLEDDFVIEGQYGVSFTPERDIEKCWISYLRPIVLADSSLQLCCLSRNGIMPIAEMGHLEADEQPLQKLMQEKKEYFSCFQQKVPQACKFCIDKDNNNSLANIARLINEHTDIYFEKACVTKSAQSMILEQNNEIARITLSQQDHKMFCSGEIVIL